jgi:hypothetical protein
MTQDAASEAIFVFLVFTEAILTLFGLAALFLEFLEPPKPPE